MTSNRNVVLVLLRADGRVEKTVQREKPTLDQLQSAVGGHIELVPYFTRLGGYARGAAYCNEYGKLHDMPLNIPATLAWQMSLDRPLTDHLRGDVVFTARTDEQADG